MFDTANHNLKHPCFYVPGTDTIIDTAELREGVWRSTIQNEDLTQIRIRYPKAELGEFEEIYRKVEASYRSQPIEITEDQFQYALCVLPPVGWRTAKGVESFKMSERYYGRITSIYVRVNDRYFSFRDTITLKAEQIAEIIVASDAYKRTSLPFMTLEQFREHNSTFYVDPKGAEIDFELLAERINRFNLRSGPRVGDFVIMPDGNTLRFTHHWTYDEDQDGGDIQTTGLVLP